MEFKVGDKIIVNSLPKWTTIWTRKVKGKFGIIVKKCCVTDCFIVEFETHVVKSTRHLCKDWFSLAKVKNQQLVFEFYGII